MTDRQALREVLDELETAGRPLGHNELANRLSIRPMELRRRIQALRRKDKVIITINRRYKRTDTDEQTH